MHGKVSAGRMLSGLLRNERIKNKIKEQKQKRMGCCDDGEKRLYDNGTGGAEDGVLKGGILCRAPC